MKAQQQVEPIQRRGRRASARATPWWRWPAMIFGLLVLVALCLDLQQFAQHKPAARSVASDLQQLVLGETGTGWAHPQGWFRVQCPAGWRMRTGAASAPYDAVLYGSAATDISIMVTPVDYDRLPALLRDIENSEAMAGLSVPKEPFFFKGVPAVRRVARLKTQTVLAIDFVKDGLAHHILCGLPPEHFEQYQVAVTEWLSQHYVPGSRKVKGEAAAGSSPVEQYP